MSAAADQYAGLGSLSELIMSSECVVRSNFNLFFETNVNPTDEDHSFVWYKFIFHKPCSFSMVLIPNSEEDRYDIEVYRVKNNKRICDENFTEVFVHVDSIYKNVTYQDNFQSGSFRSSLVHTKEVNVDGGEAIYVVINNNKGPDSGHVIDFSTCDYSYILKANKGQIDESKLNRINYNSRDKRKENLGKKLCDSISKENFGYANFLGKSMSMGNYSARLLDSLGIVQDLKLKIDLKYDSLIKAADLLMKNKQYEIAKTVYQEIMKLKPSELFAESKIVDIENLLVKQNQEKDQELNDQFTQLKKEGEAFLIANDFDRARQKMLSALALKPNDNSVNLRLKEIDSLKLMEQKRIEQESLLNELNNSISALDFSKETDKAINLISQALLISPENEKLKSELERAKNMKLFVALINSSDSLDRLSSYEMALQKINNALLLFPTDSIALLRKVIFEQKIRDEANERLLKNKVDSISSIGKKYFLEANNEVDPVKKQEPNLLLSNDLAKKARTEYMEILQLLPNDSISQDVILKIDQLIKENTSWKERKSFSDSLLVKANEAKNKQEYDQAIKYYELADSSFALTEKDKKDMEVLQLDKRNRIIQQINNLKYDSLVRSARQLMNNDSLPNLISLINILNDAAEIKSLDSSSFLLLIDSKNKFQLKLSELDKFRKYDSIMDLADSAYLKDDLEKSKILFSNAIKINPNSSYAFEKALEVENLLLDKVERARIDRIYDSIIDVAEKLEKLDSLELAKNKYELAYSVKSRETKARRKVKEIAEILFKKEEDYKKKELYKELMSVGDSALTRKKYSFAKKKYKEAFNLSKDSTLFSFDQQSSSQQKLFQMDTIVHNLTAGFDFDDKFFEIPEDPIVDLFSDGHRFYPLKLKDSVFQILKSKPHGVNRQKLTTKKFLKRNKKIVGPRYIYVIDEASAQLILDAPVKIYKEGSRRLLKTYSCDTNKSIAVVLNRVAQVLIKCDLLGYSPHESRHNRSDLIKVGEKECWFILMQNLKSGDLFSVKQVYFQPNCPVLMSGATGELDKLVEYLKENKIKIRVNGHTSGNRRINNTKKDLPINERFRGSARRLSRKRAEKVADYLIQQGIDKNRVKVKGFAGRKPVVRNPKSNLDRLKNMRVEIEVL